MSEREKGGKRGGEGIGKEKEEGEKKRKREGGREDGGDFSILLSSLCISLPPTCHTHRCNLILPIY